MFEKEIIIFSIRMRYLRLFRVNNDYMLFRTNEIDCYIVFVDGSTLAIRVSQLEPKHPRHF